jgi:hypothetical protein
MKGTKGLGIALLIVACLVLASVMVGITSEEDQSITSNDDFFTVSLTNPPVINVSSYALTIDGLVDDPMVLTYDEIISLENVTEVASLRCVTGPSGTAYYTGMPLPQFMGMIGLKEGAREIVFYSADGYSTSLTIEELNRGDVLLAWKMNNVTLPVNQGFPLKLVVPGDWGYKWAKWIVRVSVVDYDYQGYWESRGWADDASIEPISDWRVHAILLSVAAVLGGFSALSGMRNSRSKELSSRMPAIFPQKYHRYVSVAYYAVLLLTFVYWAAVTFDYRGALFYSFHGRIALITIALSVVGVVTSLPILAGRDRWRTAHLMSNLGGYIMLLITIVLGAALALG